MCKGVQGAKYEKPYEHRLTNKQSYLPNERSDVEYPGSTNPCLATESSDAVDNHRTKRTGGVDSAPGVRNEDDVCEHDRPTNGDRSGVSSARLFGNSGVEDSDHEKEGSHHFKKEGGTNVAVGRDLVDSESECRTVSSIGLERFSADSASSGVGTALGHTGNTSPQDERTNDGSNELSNHVKDTIDNGLFSKIEEGQGHGRVDVTARDVSNTVS